MKRRETRTVKARELEQELEEFIYQGYEILLAIPVVKEGSTSSVIFVIEYEVN